MIKPDYQKFIKLLQELPEQAVKYRYFNVSLLFTIGTCIKLR